MGPRQGIASSCGHQTQDSIVQNRVYSGLGEGSQEGSRGRERQREGESREAEAAMTMWREGRGERGDEGRGDEGRGAQEGAREKLRVTG